MSVPLPPTPPPPPPPAPGAPPLPPSPSGGGKPMPVPSSERGDLLAAIRKGRALKHTEINDRSGPVQCMFLLYFQNKLNMDIIILIIIYCYSYLI